MATGDAADMAARMRRVLPTGWFADEAPVLDIVLPGLGAGLSTLYGLIDYAALQTRLATVSDTWLDLAGLDYRGATFLRRPGETDTQYRARLLPILRDAATRPALIARLEAITGNVPWVFEPSRPADTGGYGIACGYGGGTPVTLLAVGTGPTVLATDDAGTLLSVEDDGALLDIVDTGPADAVLAVDDAGTLLSIGGDGGSGGGGAYGSMVLPYQVFIRVDRPAGSGIPGVAGYGVSVGCYGLGSIEYASLDMELPHITDADIYAAIVDVLPIGVTAWVALGNASPVTVSVADT